MPSADHWLLKYGGSDEKDTALRWLCVPAIVLGLVGLLWSLPIPAAFRESSPAINWGTVFLSATLVYYFVVSIPLALGALPFVIAVVAIVMWLDALDGPLWPVSAALFFVAWPVQWLTLKQRDPDRSAFRDLQFVMLGPLWLLARVYRRIGIPY